VTLERLDAFISLRKLDLLRESPEAFSTPRSVSGSGL